MLALHVIGSGSKGNAAIVEDAATGQGILIDCGICKRDVLGFAKEAGFDIRGLQAILITHDHADHVSKMGVIVRGLKHPGIPVYALPEVLEALHGFEELGNMVVPRPMALGDGFSEAGIHVLPVPTSHDAAASCGFLFRSDDGDVLGYVTDTGYVTDAMKANLRNVRILALESNHDVRMLREGPYPRYLQERILSDRGHLSNEQAADALAQLAGPRLQHVIAMHLSEHNNLPSLAREALQRTLAEAGSNATVHVASQRRLVSIR